MKKISCCLFVAFAMCNFTVAQQTPGAKSQPSSANAKEKDTQTKQNPRIFIGEVIRGKFEEEAGGTQVALPEPRVRAQHGSMQRVVVAHRGTI